MLLRERERRIELEKREREKSGPPPLTPTKHHREDRHLRTSEASTIYRPFEQTLVNGFERNHFTDYERRKLTERILAENRQILPDRPRTQHTPSSSSEHNHLSESRTYEHHHAVDERASSYQDKHPDARVAESDKSHNSHTRRFNQYEYDRPHAEYPNFNSHTSQVKTELKTEHDSSKVVPPSGLYRPAEVPSGGTRYRPEESSHTAFQKYKPVVTIMSRLDIEEQKIREARQNGTYDSEDEELEEDEEDSKDERKRQRLLLISEGPPLPLEKPRQKMKFLNMFGLTTMDHRKGRLGLTPSKKLFGTFLFRK